MQIRFCVTHLTKVLYWEISMQIFHNLIGNALKYKTPQTKPIIKVVAQDKESHWLFSVEDNGIGIQKEFQQKIQSKTTLIL